jgi:hypothetical protein
LNQRITGPNARTLYDWAEQDQLHLKLQPNFPRGNQAKNKRPHRSHPTRSPGGQTLVASPRPRPASPALISPSPSGVASALVSPSPSPSGVAPSGIAPTAVAPTAVAPSVEPTASSGTKSVLSPCSSPYLRGPRPCAPAKTGSSSRLTHVPPEIDSRVSFLSISHSLTLKKCIAVIWIKERDT